MSLNNIHAGDYGYPLDLVVVQDGEAKDISSYMTTRQYIFTAPDGTETPKDVGFATDGKNGVLRYMVEAGLIEDAGEWKVRVFLSKIDSELTSDTLRFPVAERGG